MGTVDSITLMMIKTLLLAVLLVFSVSAQRGGGRGGRGKPKCADGSKPTCSDGSEPVFDGDKSTPPCPDGGKPKTCADGSTPTGRGGRGRCAKEEKICCYGS